MEKINTISEIKEKIAKPARQYGIQKIYLFGSYSRGEAEIKSDIDICIEKGKLRTLFEFSGFCQELEEIFGNKVDVVTTTGITDEFRNKIKKDMILIYG